MNGYKIGNMYLDLKDAEIISKVAGTPGMRLSQIADDLDMPKNTMHYRLKTLEKAGFIRCERGRCALKVYPITEARHDR